MATKQPSIRRLTLKQYKSIEKCDLELGSLTILAGRNGAGKSNVLDALSFVSDSLNSTLEYAVRKRGGIAQVRRRSSSKPTHPVVAVEMLLPSGDTARYSFVIAATKDPLFVVEREECVVLSPSGKVMHQYKTARGEVTAWSSTSPKPPVAIDRLYLVPAAGLTEFRPVYDILTKMVFHNLNPERMKTPQRPEPGTLLAHDGSNIASVVKQLGSSAPDKLARVLQYIRAIGVPIREIQHKQAGSLETLSVLQGSIDGTSGHRSTAFDALSLSDGTIRALGILVSLVSVGPDGATGPSLIGIEEPETALHPAAAGALMDALTEGSETTQLIVTCHSPDLLDHESIGPEMIVPVMLEDGKTRVGKLDPSKADLLQNHLTTAGELLRLDQLELDPEDLKRQDEAVGTLFEASH